MNLPTHILSTPTQVFEVTERTDSWGITTLHDLTGDEVAFLDEYGEPASDYFQPGQIQLELL